MSVDETPWARRTRLLIEAPTVCMATRTLAPHYIPNAGVTGDHLPGIGLGVTLVLALSTALVSFLLTTWPAITSQTACFLRRLGQDADECIFSILAGHGKLDRHRDCRVQKLLAFGTKKPLQMER